MRRLAGRGNVRLYGGILFLIVPRRFLYWITNGPSSIFPMQAIPTQREEVIWLSTSPPQAAKRTCKTWSLKICIGNRAPRTIWRSSRPLKPVRSRQQQGSRKSVFSARFGRVCTMCQPTGQSMSIVHDLALSLMPCTHRALFFAAVQHPVDSRINPLRR